MIFSSLFLAWPLQVSGFSQAYRKKNAGGGALPSSNFSKNAKIFSHLAAILLNIRSSDLRV
jgi:hypothetical protein